jgi:hypothetical protein
VFQVLAMKAHFMGPKSLRTATEFHVSSSMFHLGIAAQALYQYDHLGRGPRWPTNWDELIRDTQDYEGPHLSGRLLSAYPMLGKSHDPWGNPWVFRVVELVVPDDDLSWLQLTFGSVGPDGQECLDKAVDYESRRQICDDLLRQLRVGQVPRRLIPPHTPQQPAPSVSVPLELWGTADDGHESDPPGRVRLGRTTSY